MVNIEDLKDIHKDQRCFVIGTGPSLNNTNLSLIRDEILIGCNGLFLGYDKFGINCQYYAVSDKASWATWGQELTQLDTILFIYGDALRKYRKSNKEGCQYKIKAKIIELQPRGDVGHNGWPPSTPIEDRKHNIRHTFGCVTTSIVLHLAYYFGCKTTYLLGQDFDFTSGHFYNDHPHIHNPYENLSKSFEIHKEVFEDNGREIIDCTVDGNLDVFKKQPLEEVING